jgi:hypothetical protein
MPVLVWLWITCSTLSYAYTADTDVLSSQHIKHIVTRDDLKHHQFIAHQEIMAELRRTHSQSKLELTVSDLELLVERDILSGPQAKKLWDFLIDKQEPVDSEDFYVFHDAMFLGAFSIVSFFYGIGSAVIILFYALAIRLAFSMQTPFILLVSSAGFASLFYVAGFALHYSYNSGLVAGSLLLACNIALLLGLHSILVMLGISRLELELDDVIPVGKYKVKLFVCCVNLAISYYFSLICCFPIVQLPFYFTLAYLAGMVGMTLHFVPPLILAPFSIYVMTVYGLGLLAYLSIAQDQAFKVAYLPAVARVDFRLVGYLSSLSILSWSVPLLMSVNYFGDHAAFKDTFICFQTIRTKWFNPEFKEYGPRVWRLKEVWSYAYLAFSIAAAVFGIYAGCWVIIISSQVFLFFALHSMPHSDNFFPDKTLYPFLYAALLVTPMLLDDVPDISQPQLSIFFKDSLIWATTIWGVRVFCALLAAWANAAAQHLSSL